jgi:uncharacterized membrane protein
MHLQQTAPYYDGYQMMNGSGWGSLMILTMVFLTVAIVIWISWSMHIHTPNTSLDIASRRYASGEISKKEYDQFKTDLR